MIADAATVQENGTGQVGASPIVGGALATEHFLRLIPRDFARQHLILSQGFDDAGVERLAVSESTSVAAVHNVGVRLKRKITATITDGEAIARAVDDAYETHSRISGAEGGDGHDRSRAVFAEDEDVDRLLAQADRDLLSTQGKAPVVKLVDAMLFEALGRGASDIHVQPLADRTLVRYRLDGVLHTVRQWSNSRKLTEALVSRIKVMGRMDIAERRVPQDGRATVSIGLRNIDLRISTLPTSYGERAVLRLLDNSHHLCDFAALGMPPDVADAFLERARRANGMILLTGPTGSGKTTTLYSTLRLIATTCGSGAGGWGGGGGGLNIMTIEDPIEYELSSLGDGAASGALCAGISQSQVNAKKGVTFATGLRHILRQDPDVVMVGEIRDAETARIAIQSSLTGHLVFSTLHTNDAPSAVTRLMDLGVESYLVSASLSAVLAQRLVRKLHSECDGSGCDECLHTGLRGRTGLFELLVVDEQVRELISHGSGLSQIREAARRLGMKTLRDDGLRMVAEGVTSQAEVDRVVHGAF